MRPILAALLLALVAPAARADLVTATFEDRNPGPDAIATDFRTSNDRFVSEGVAFSNHYVPPSGGFADFYSGFAVSSKVDNTLVDDPFGSSDYAKAGMAYAPAPAGSAGAGSGGSATYAVAFNYFVGDAVIDLPAGYDPASIDVANTTYAASAIRFGDAYSRPFQSGDYFRLHILGFSGPGAAGAPIGDVPVTLAEFSGASLALLDRFTTIDLGPLAGARSLAFSLETNVTNRFGPSLPFTFAVDSVVAVSPVPEPAGLLLVALGTPALALAARRRARMAHEEWA